jgi:hypothetical protein
MATLSSSPSNLSFPRIFSLRRVLIGFAVITSLLLHFNVAWMLRGQIATGVTDFSAFYTGGKIVVSGNGSNLYDLATQERVEGAFTVRKHSAGFLPYNHAPFETVLLAPLAAFPFSTAAWIWWACNLPLGYLVLFLLCPHLPHLNNHLGLAILGLGFFFPLLLAECQGQDSVLTLLLFTVCFVNLARGRAWIAGSALAHDCDPRGHLQEALAHPRGVLPNLLRSCGPVHRPAGLARLRGISRVCKKLRRRF